MEDIKNWTRSYVSRDPALCLAALKQTCQDIRRAMEANDPAQAIRSLDLVMNGMIVIQNARVADMSSHLSFLSAVQAMIMLDDHAVAEIERSMGRRTSAEGRRSTATAALMDAKDFSSSKAMKEIYSSAIHALKRGRPFSHALELMAPGHPSELFFCLSQVIDHL